jgi:outer membrane lipoprotein-sorting protein
MLKKSMLTLLTLSALAATGCGHGAETQVEVPEEDYTATTPLPTRPQPGYPGAPGGPGMTAAPGLAQLQQAWAAVRTVSATYDLWEKGTKGTETANVKFYFKKPGQYRYEVSKHSASIKNGSKSVFNSRTRQIESRLAGLLGAVPIKGTLDDERSKSVRNYTLDMTDYATQTELLLAPGARVTQRAPNVLELAQPTKYKGIEALRVTLDPQRGLPVAFELVERGVVVYRKKITGLQVNPSLGSDKFSL